MVTASSLPCQLLGVCLGLEVCEVGLGGIELDGDLLGMLEHPR